MYSEEKKRVTELLLQLIDSLSDQEKREFVDVIMKRGRGMPISVFQSKLSGLELLVRYLRDVEQKSFKEIAQMLNRNVQTIYTTYRKAKIKFPDQLDLSNYSVIIPLDIFTNRKFSVLESIVFYLKNQGLNFRKIATLLNRDYNTVRTVYLRYSKKNEK